MADQLTYVPQHQMLRLHSDPRAFATAARVNALSMAAHAGCGHLGGSFSAIDIMVWLYLREMRPEDVFILSKGHAALGLYAVLHGMGILTDADLLTFRDGKGGLPAHPSIDTPGIACNTGSLGMGISKAKGMLFADRLCGIKRRYYILIGDGEFQEGQMWESLHTHVHPMERLRELTVIQDNNGIQGSGWVRGARPKPDHHPLLTRWEHAVELYSEDPMAFLALAFATDIPEENNGFRILNLPTTKGKGVSFMENDPAWHSRAPSEQEYEAALAELLARLPKDIETFTVPHTWPPPMQPEPLVAAYGAALLQVAEQHPELVVLDADLAREHGLLAFKERYPERFFECGIAEQDMVSIASGMALRGLLPVVHSHAAFLTRRALDQVHNQTTERTRVIYVGGSAGKLQPNGNGKSHETLIDGTTMSLLGMPVHEPHTPEDVAPSLARALGGNGPAYIRLLKQPERRRD